MLVRLCVHRHRGEIYDMGADQEGARIITTQSKAEENHNKLYDRWVTDCTVCTSYHSWMPREAEQCSVPTDALTVGRNVPVCLPTPLCLVLSLICCFGSFLSDLEHVLFQIFISPSAHCLLPSPPPPPMSLKCLGSRLSVCLFMCVRAR